MIVVADTSPLNYLIQIEYEGLLPKLFGRILVPEAVMREMRDQRAPLAVRHWIEDAPNWIEIAPQASAPDPTRASLGRGEREAIQLAVERNADLLLIDELKGRYEAARRGLLFTGTLGVFLRAGKLELIDPGATYMRLISETSFRTSDALEARFLGQIRDA